MKWVIDKAFECDYGHRVWVQTLNTEYTESGHIKPMCRHLHGHRGVIHVFLESDSLNKQGMVEDFVHLGWFKNFIDNTIDHQFIIDISDPLFEAIVQGKLSGQLELCDGIPTGKLTTITKLILPRSNGENRQLPVVPIIVPGTDKVVGYKVDTNESCVLGKSDIFVSVLEKELYNSFVFVDFVPTSENLSKWLFEIVQEKMSKIGATVVKLDFFETPKSRSSYQL